MDRKIRSILQKYPFLSYVKIDRLLREHGLGLIPNSLDYVLSYRQANCIINYVHSVKQVPNGGFFKLRKLNINNKPSQKDSHLEFLKECSLGVSLPVSSFDALKEIVKVADNKCCLTSKFMVHLYKHIEGNLSLKKFFVDNQLKNFIKAKIMPKRNSRQNTFDCEILSIYDKETNKEEKTFDILTPQKFILNWNDVTFHDGYLSIRPPRLQDNIHFAPVDIRCSQSISALNKLTEYFQCRLPKINCVAKDNKLTIEDEIDLSQAIRYIKGVSKKPVLCPEIDGQHEKKVAVQPVFFTHNFDESKTMSIRYSIEELKKLKSRYINYLVEKQKKEYRIIPCNEKVVHISSIGNKIECAFIFTIAANTPRRIILAIENLNTDRATMLFSFERHYYEKALRGIYEYLRSGEANKRSSLRKWDCYGLEGIQLEYHPVNHRNDKKHPWYEILRYRLRTM